jgi:hypothetical protein
MKITQQENTLKVEHEHGDDPIRKDSVFWFRLRTALKRQGRPIHRYHLKLVTGQGVHGLLDTATDSVIFDPQSQVRDLADEYKKIGMVHLAVQKLDRAQ